MYAVGKGKIGGSYCDYFWMVNEDGTIGGSYSTPIIDEEQRQQILSDIRRHREKLLEQLIDLQNAERVLTTKPKFLRPEHVAAMKEFDKGLRILTGK